MKIMHNVTVFHGSTITVCAYIHTWSIYTRLAVYELCS